LACLGPILCAEAVFLGKYAKQRDTTIDDGKPDGGSLRATAATAFSASDAAATAFADSISYLLSMGF